MSTPSASSSRDELLFLGTTCQHPDCNLNDFLPFACPACDAPFCQAHFLPSVHACSAPLPPSMVDRIAPQCPMCREVVAYPPGGREDPNAAVERHIASGCAAMEGGAARRKAALRQKKAQGKVCWRRGCTKALIVDMRCDACAHNFCPSHRHQKEHECKAGAGAGGTRSGAKTANSRLLGLGLGARLPSVSSGSGAGSAAKPPAAAAKTPAKHPAPVPAGTRAAAASAGAELDARAAAAAAAMKRAGTSVKVPFVKTKAEKCVPPPRA